VIPSIISAITGGLLSQVTGIVKLFIDKKITEEEMKVRLEGLILDAFTKQFSEMQATIRSSVVFARAVAFVLVSQTFVLLWYQWGAGAYQIATGTSWPSPGTTIDWAYALVALVLGGGAWLVKRA
jgi:hypothetical protein